MTYTVETTKYNLILSLTSNSTTPPRLDIYRNDSDTRFKFYTSSTQSSPYTYTIPLSDYNIGDVITKCVLVQNVSLKPWQTSEGVSIILDGEEVASNLHTNTYTISDGLLEGYHSIQAVYCGNDEYAVSSTPKWEFNITQPTVSGESSTPPSTGNWKLKFTNDKLTSTTYGKSTKIKFKLSKGNYAISGRVVETVNPTTVVSHTTNSKGIVSMDSVGWSAGKYRIGAYFTDDSKIVTSVYRDITVEKAPSKITMSTGSFSVGDEIDFYVRYNNSVRLPDDSKIQFTVNNKTKTYKLTNSNYTYKFEKSGTYEIKIAYAGNSNIKPCSFATTITIPSES